jgi:hypothetical protein
MYRRHFLNGIISKKLFSAAPAHPWARGICSSLNFKSPVSAKAFSHYAVCIAAGKIFYFVSLNAGEFDRILMIVKFDLYDLQMKSII